MGQKINPLGLRLGENQKHHSLWFAQSKSYSLGLQEDEKIRNCIKKYVQKNRKISSVFVGIAHIEIQKETDLIKIIIHVGNPKKLFKVKENRTQEIKELRINVQKGLNSVNWKLNIAIRKVTKPYRQPNFLAEYIALQLKNRVPFRKAMKKAAQK